MYAQANQPDAAYTPFKSLDPNSAVAYAPVEHAYEEAAPDNNQYTLFNSNGQPVQYAIPSAQGDSTDSYAQPLHLAGYEQPIHGYESSQYSEPNATALDSPYYSQPLDVKKTVNYSSDTLNSQYNMYADPDAPITIRHGAIEETESEATYDAASDPSSDQHSQQQQQYYSSASNVPNAYCQPNTGASGHYYSPATNAANSGGYYALPAERVPEVVYSAATDTSTANGYYALPAGRAPEVVYSQSFNMAESPEYGFVSVICTFSLLDFLSYLILPQLQASLLRRKLSKISCCNVR
jgi:hypothetical protein